MISKNDARLLEEDDPLLEFFNKAEPLHMQLPIWLKNNVVLTELQGACGFCGEPTQADDTRGDCFPEGPVSYRIYTALLCRRCDALHYNVFRVGPCDFGFAMENLTDEMPDPFVPRLKHPVQKVAPPPTPEHVRELKRLSQNLTDERNAQFTLALLLGTLAVGVAWTILGWLS